MNQETAIDALNTLRTTLKNNPNLPCSYTWFEYWLNIIEKKLYEVSDKKESPGITEAS